MHGNDITSGRFKYTGDMFHSEALSNDNECAPDRSVNENLEDVSMEMSNEMIATSRPSSRYKPSPFLAGGDDLKLPFIALTHSLCRLISTREVK